MVKIKSLIIILVLTLLSVSLFGADFELQYKCQNSQTNGNQIQPHFNIQNNSGSSVNLSDFTIRYYYTKEGSASEQMNIDYAVIGGGNITSSFESGYVEFGFSGGAGSMGSGGESGQIQARFHKTDWSNYDQSNDYSYGPNVSSFTDYEKVTLYRSGSLVWGTPEGGSTSAPPSQDPPSQDPPSQDPPSQGPPQDGPGTVSLTPESQEVAKGASVVVTVRVDTGNQNVAAYGIDVTYSSNILLVNTDLGTNGVTAGSDGYVSAVNAETPGIIIISGFDVAGTGPSSRLDLVDINFIAENDGTATLRVSAVNTLSDADYEDVGDPGAGKGATVKVGVGPTPSQGPPQEGPGTVSLTPANQEVVDGADVIVSVRVDTGNQNLAAYGIDVTYSSNILLVNTDLGTNGVTAGSDGYVSAVNAETPGIIVISGFDVNGTGPSSRLDLVDINFKAINEGTATLRVSAVNSLSDAEYEDVGEPGAGEGAIVYVDDGGTPKPPKAGLVNLKPASQTVPLDSDVIVSVEVNTGNQNLAAYGIDVSYPAAILSVKTGVGTNGVTAGPDGFVSAVNPETPGILVISGFDVNGKGPSETLDLVDINFTAIGEGTGTLRVSDVNSLTDSSYDDVGTPEAGNSAIVIVDDQGTPKPPKAGLVNLKPASQKVPSNSDVIVSVEVNTGNQNLAAYGIDVSYPAAILSVKTGVGTNGVTAGSDGFVSAVNPETAGVIVISGFDVNGKGPSEALDLVDINFTAISDGTATLRVSDINSLTDSAYDDVGTPEAGNNAIVIVGEEVSPTPKPPKAGMVNLKPASQKVPSNSDVIVSVEVNTGNQNLAAYGIDVSYPAAILSVKTGVGTNGVTAGSDGFVSAVNPETAGVIVISGFDVNGKGPSEALDLVDINFTAISDGTATLRVSDINSLTDSSYDDVGTPEAGNNAIVIVGEEVSPTPKPPKAGMVNLKPASQKVPSNSAVIVSVEVNTGNQNLAAYGIDVSYPAGILMVNTNVGTNGVTAGSDGFVSAVNPETAGVIVISGFDVNGKGPSEALDLVDINFTAISDGTATLRVSDINSLTDSAYDDVGTPEAGNNAIVIVGEEVSPTPKPPKAGMVNLKPASQNVPLDSAVIVSVEVNTGNQNLAAYGIDVSYPAGILELNTSVGTNGVTAGSEGYVSAVNPDTAGLIIISGFDVNGKGPSETLDLVDINFKAISNGIANLAVTDVNSLTDSTYEDVGDPSPGNGAEVIVGSPPPTGDILTSADFENGFGEWVNVSGDSHDWDRDSDGTTSSSTGPSSGADGSMWYVYVETSSSGGGANSAGDTAYLQGPAINGSNRVLSFYYHMYGVDCGTLSVDVNSGGSWTNDVWTMSGPQQSSSDSAYRLATVDLSSYSGSITIRLRLVAAGSSKGDVAIDNIVVTGDSGPTNPPSPGVGVVNLGPESQTKEYDTSIVISFAVNTGTQKLAAYSLDITYPEDIMRLDTSVGTNGVVPGEEGFVSAVNDTTDGLLLISGFDVNGTGPSIDLELGFIHFIASGNGSGVVEITSVNSLTDEALAVIGVPTVGTSAAVSVFGEPSPTPSRILIEADFTGGAEDFTYVDDAFRNTNQADYADGQAVDGALEVTIGAVNNDDIVDMSGGWSASFTLESSSEVTASFDYRLFTVNDYESDEYGEVLVSVDGELFGSSSSDDFVARQIDGGDSGWQSFDFTTGTLGTGSHTIIIGGYNNKKTTTSEYTVITIDNVIVEGVGGQVVTESPTPTPTPTLTPTPTPTPTPIPTPTIEPPVGVVLTSADFEDGFGEWVNVSGDSHDWDLDSGGTSSSSTGPSAGANGSSYYVYLETSGGSANSAGDTAYLQGPAIGGTDRELTFYYHMYGVDCGTLNVDVNSGGSWTEGVWSIDGAQQSSSSSAYTQAVVDLSSFSGTITIRIRIVAAGSSKGDVAVDDIEVTGTGSGPTDPPTGVGTVNLGPASQSVDTGSDVTVDISVNTGSHLLAAYGITVTYPADILTVNLDLGTNGVQAGSQGYVTAVNAETTGELIISGFDVTGTGPSSTLDLATINFIASGNGSGEVTVTAVDNLNDENYEDVGVPKAGTSAKVDVNIGPTPTVQPPTATPTVQPPTATPTVPPTEPPPVGPTGPGAVIAVPAAVNASSGSSFTSQIYLDSGSQKVAAYGFDITYDDSALSVESVVAGSDGFISALNPNDPGVIVVSGFDVSGKGPGGDMNLLTITWNAISNKSSTINIIVNSLIDTSYADIGTPAGGSVKVN